jgi:rRNA maturation endonuclease Nob1
MERCWRCKTEYDWRLDLDDCPKCGTGLVVTDDDDYLDIEDY